MEIKGNVHCFFEQSGTFKNEFIKLGYEAFDYDIQNDFGETDFQIDLFPEIEKGYEEKESIFDNITKDDFVIAFFPCIYFETMQTTYYQMTNTNIKKQSIRQKYKTVIDRIQKREYFYILLYKLFAICEIRGIRLVLENPATHPHYLLHPQNFISYTFIDNDRTKRGDCFKKPTAYWFVNCKPTTGQSYEKPDEIKKIKQCMGGGKDGICSKERSMLTGKYARNFICDFIIGKEQKHSIRSLF